MSDTVARHDGDDYALISAVSADRPCLLAFAAAVWPDQEPERRLRAAWWLRAGPDHAVVAVHRPSGAVAGICGGRHCVWTIAGRNVPAVAICDWYVAQDHAGKGLGKRLVGHFDNPDRFLYAFSISDAAVANFRKLGWTGPYRSSLLVRLMPRLAWRSAKLLQRAGLDVTHHECTQGEPLGELGKALDRIEARRRDDAPAHMRRDAAEWSWRLSVCADRRYRIAVVRRGHEPLGYVAVRRMMPGRSGLLDRLRVALISDLAAADDDPAVLDALAAEACAIAADLDTRALLTAMTAPSDRAALGRAGFASPVTPILGRVLMPRSPQFMWLPRGPAAKLGPENLALSFADVALDLDL